MIGAAAHTAAMLGVGGAAGSGWERRGATQIAVAAGAVEQLSEHVLVCVCPSAERNALSPGVL